MSAVAAIHAHTIEQLLSAVLPLSIDMDYWAAQDSGAISLALYFVESLPARAYVCITKAAAAMIEFAMRDNVSLRQVAEELYNFLSTRLLFPDLPLVRNSSLARLPQVPEKVNILSLTRREVRGKLRGLELARNSLALQIGQLSQASAVDNQTAISVTGLVEQIADIINSADRSRSEPISVQGDADLATLAASTLDMARRINSLSSSQLHKIKAYRRPSLFTRAWLPGIVVLCSVRYLSQYISGRSEDIANWAKDSLTTMCNYVSQYIIQPLRSGYETIRYGKHTYSVTTEESLVSDFQSLEDMVVRFASRFGNSDATAIRQRVMGGDLSDVMSVYAREMQQPFRNVLFGDLVQAMLIQVQKVKVDVGQTMAALDKLLKSNELNFLLLSTVPATLTLYSAASWVSSLLSRWISGASRHAVASIQVSMRDIDRLLNIDESKPVPPAVQGQLICLTLDLRRQALALPNAAAPGVLRLGHNWLPAPPRARSMFLQDVRDLESARLSGRQKRQVIERMHRTFRFL
ncbi:NCA2-domain-containing protein [Linderina pennispora]|uniref:NCA2-domain-containing protein n=1 Tax=Linderina pennispora TaxID=61395 RepID=A0A1Y1W2J8_9FUNG|nr:NCA2-domain-containing protein [Linderina pennispora]ORX67759.1 NCA2-domain-containing protein [Linderina pennispora]